MSGFVKFKTIRGLNVYRKPIVAAAIVAITIGISVVCGKECVAGSNDISEVEVLSKQIKDNVKGLEYSDKVAEDFAKMVMSWKDSQGEPILLVWKKKLNQGRQDYRQAKISKEQFAVIEVSLIKELSRRIEKQFFPDITKKFFDLADIIKHRKAQCVGYSQLFYVLGSCIDLSLKAIFVQEEATGKLADHVACLVCLDDGATVMVDLWRFVSKPFIFKKEFRQVGNYWELTDANNPVKIHRNIQVLDRNGLIAMIHIKRGNVYRKLGQITKAMSEYNRTIELNPKYASAYLNRGISYYILGQLVKAISEYNRAIQLNPKSAKSYSARGVAYGGLGQLTKAFSDLKMAIQLNPNLADAYNNRGSIYVKLGQHSQAIYDFDKAIELNPKFAQAYAYRGYSYARLKEYTKAISDCTKAIELNPKLAQAYDYRGNAYARSKEYTKAISDYTKAIELNPKFAVLYLNRGLAYAFSGKLNQAKEDLLRAEKLKPDLRPKVKQISEQFKLNLKLD